MPIPQNWLEELVIEWLDLDGFLVSTSVTVSAEGGGRFAPDAVGVKRLTSGGLLIRHCESAMFLIDSPEKIASRYAKKFSNTVEREVRRRFDATLNARKLGHVDYEKIAITFQASQNVVDALMRTVPGVKIWFLKDFICNQVLPTIRKWKSEPGHTKATAMPADKWIIDVIDRFGHFGLLANGTTE